MKKIAKNKGIVIKVRDYLENAVLTAIYTESGKGTFLIRGAKKINSSTRKFANILTELEFNATMGNGICVLTEGIIIDNYTNLKEDLNKFYITNIILEKLDYFSEQFVDPNLVYNFVKELLEMLENTDYIFAISMIFEIKLLYLLGVAPSFNRCPLCNKKAINGALLISSGGYICEDCQFARTTSLNIEDSLLFKKIYSTKIKDVTNDFLFEINNNKNIQQIIDDYYEYHLDFTSKVKKVIRKIG